ncbi:MAG: hypothetical protein M3X11_06250 [Acidobacteriota bacterium]|nr:hypothetical protein [Acidobacteriota bacterium]
MKIQRDTSVASRLLRAVIAKSFVEVALVCLVATLAALTTFSPQLRGAIDVAGGGRVAGWVHDPQSPDQSIEVQLFIDEKFVAAMRADERRDDLVSTGATTQPHHGFSFSIESLNLTGGEHRAQAYAVRNAAGANKILLPITAAPHTFRVDQNRER